MNEPLATRLLPTGSWDCHTHVFGPPEAFPLRRDGPGKANTDASVEALLALHRSLGIGHGCLVQPVEYGPDHSYLLHALQVTGGAYRGVAMADPALGAADFRALGAGGVNALRFMFMDAMGLTPTPEILRDRIGLVRDLGWRLRILGAPATHPRLFEILAAVDDAPILLEHMALTGPGGAHEPRLDAFLAKPNVWLMLSSGHRRSQEGPPWRDMAATGHELYVQAPARRVWGSDWPYLGAGPRIPERDALSLLRSYLADDGDWRAVLAENPAAFNG